MKIKDSEKKIMLLEKESSSQINELKEYQENNLANEQKILYFQEKNNQIMNELNNINQKENYIKVNIANFFQNFFNQILDILNQSEINLQNMNNPNSNSNNNLLINNDINNKEFIIKEEYFNITKEIPILSKVKIIYNEIKKILNIFFGNYINIKNSFDNQIINLDKNLKNMNETILDLSQKLSIEKEKNNLLIKNNTNSGPNKLYEMNRNIFDSNYQDNSNLYLKIETIKSFVENIYENVLNKYNEIITNIKIRFNFRKFKINKNKYSQNINNEYYKENDIKEMLFEIEKIFHEVIEYIKYTREDTKSMNGLEKDIIQLKNEKIELIKKINKLQNEIDSISIDNKNKNENLRVQYEINLNEKIKEIENKNNEVIKQLNEQINIKNEEIVKVNKNYNLLYNQYKIILRNNN